METTRELDGTGLYYYRARYYHPTLSRFISEDPIEYAAGANVYAYVGGDPVRRVDPYGEDALEIVGGSRHSMHQRRIRQMRPGQNGLAGEQR